MSRVFDKSQKNIQERPGSERDRLLQGSGSDRAKVPDFGKQDQPYLTLH